MPRVRSCHWSPSSSAQVDRLEPAEPTIGRLGSAASLLYCPVGRSSRSPQPIVAEWPTVAMVPGMPNAEASLSRQNWIEAAYSMIESGEAISIRATAQLLGVTTGSFYHHFTDRHDLVAQVSQHHNQLAWSHCERADSIEDARRRLGGFLHGLISSRDIQRADVALETERRDPEIRKGTAEVDRRIEDWISSLLITIGYEPRFARQQVPVIYAVFHGVAVSTAAGSTAWSDEDRSEFAATVTRTLLAAADCGFSPSAEPSQPV